MNLMLLETRALPLPLRVLFLHKSRAGIAFADEKNLLRAVAWAVEKRIDEVYLLDPSLNVRPPPEKAAG